MMSASDIHGLIVFLIILASAGVLWFVLWFVSGILQDMSDEEHEIKLLEGRLQYEIDWAQEFAGRKDKALEDHYRHTEDELDRIERGQ